MSATRAPLQADAPENGTAERLCDAPGCAAAGLYRAPKSRLDLRDFHWFCLPHVREYNLAWDYYRDMSEAEVEANLRADTLWQRPTWPLGQLGHAARLQRLAEAQREFGFAAPRPAAPKLPGELRQALEVLGLAWPVALPAVKARYKTLAKRYHPDANNGDRGSEERFKSINLAYTTVSGKFADFLLRHAADAAGWAPGATNSTRQEPMHDE